MSLKLFALRTSNLIKNIYHNDDDEQLNFNTEIDITEFFKGVNNINSIPINNYIEIDINILYKFNDFSPEIYLDVLDGITDEIIYTSAFGISALPNIFNKIGDKILIKPIQGNNLKIKLRKRDETNDIMILGKDSFYKVSNIGKF